MTYKNLDRWYDELQDNCRGMPTIVVANKIDVDYKVSRGVDPSRNVDYKVAGAGVGLCTPAVTWIACSPALRMQRLL